MKALLVVSSALILAFASFLAYGSSDSNAAETAKTAAETTALGKIYTLSSVAPKAAKDMMTDFSWKEGDKTMSLSKLGENKIIFLNFWGTWCPPCRKEIPDIVAISNEMKNVVVVGVALEQGTTDKLAAFVEQSKIPYINIVSNDNLRSQLTQAYGGIQYVPTTFIITKGKIVKTLVGGQSKAAFVDAIKSAM